MIPRRPLRWITSVGLVLVAVQGCGDAPAEPPATALGDGAVTIGSFDFAESELLAEIYGQALEARGHTVERAFRLGPREFLEPALASGLVELVPEYAGTALEFLSLGEEEPTSGVRGTHEALVGALRDRPVLPLAAAPAQNANAVVVTRATAQRLGLRAISDLDDEAATMTFGGPPECPSRPFCLAGLRDVYGLSFRTFVALDVGGPLTREALERGDIDVALMFTTDPTVDEFVVLRDDLGLQPAENVVPLVHRSVVERWGEDIVTGIDEVSARLTTSGLRALNAAMADGRAASDVASAWLAEQDLR